MVFGAFHRLPFVFDAWKPLAVNPLDGDDTSFTNQMLVECDRVLVDSVAKPRKLSGHSDDPPPVANS